MPELHGKPGHKHHLRSLVLPLHSQLPASGTLGEQGGCGLGKGALTGSHRSHWQLRPRDASELSSWLQTNEADRKWMATFIVRGAGPWGTGRPILATLQLPPGGSALGGGGGASSIGGENRWGGAEKEEWVLPPCDQGTVHLPQASTFPPPTTPESVNDWGFPKSW